MEEVVAVKDVMEDAVEEYMNTPTIAKLLGKTAYSVQIDIQKGILSAEKRGAHYAVRSDDAWKYIDLKKAAMKSITAREMVKRTGLLDHRIITDAIRKGDLPAFKLTNGRNSFWHILEDDAKNYAHSMGWKYSIDGIEPELTHQCSACGTTRGNIVGDVDKQTGEKYGLLCMRCYPLVRDFGSDPVRMHQVLKYVEKTRLTQKKVKKPVML